MTHPIEQLEADLSDLLADEITERPHNRTVVITRRQLRAAISLAELYLQAREKAIFHNGDKPDLQSSLTPLSDTIDPDFTQTEKRVSQWQTTKVSTPTQSKEFSLPELQLQF